MSRSSTDPEPLELADDRAVKIRIAPEVFEYFALKGKRRENRRLPHHQIAWEVEQPVRELTNQLPGVH
jgi:hypothetical protein